MDAFKKTAFTTLLLSLVAGYCDTATFVSAGGTFSAHVTGNFIVFASRVVFGGDTSAWLKLLTFPVFMLAVMAGGWMLTRVLDKNKVLLIEGFILIAAGVLTMAGYKGIMDIVVVMMTVFAMGMQNAYGKVYPKEIFGPTTMMTGNVTQAALDIRNFFLKQGDPQIVRDSLIKQCFLIGGFLAGCLIGGYLSKCWGLISISIAGIIVINGYLVCNAKTTPPADVA